MSDSDGHDNAVALATLAADNAWVKSSLLELNQGVKELQAKMDASMGETRTHYATVESMTELERKLNKITIIIVTAAITFSGTIAIEIFRVLAGKGL